MVWCAVEGWRCGRRRVEKRWVSGGNGERGKTCYSPAHKTRGSRPRSSSNAEVELLDAGGAEASVESSRRVRLRRDKIEIAAAGAVVEQHARMQVANRVESSSSKEDVEDVGERGMSSSELSMEG